MVQVFIALGSNIVPREGYLEEAVTRMQEKIEILIISSLYQTEPVGYLEQGPFLNAVLKGLTSLHPLELLSFLQEIEKQLYRTKEIRWGPRTIDLDILLYGERVFQSQELIIPHPRMEERPFVLIPLGEIYTGPLPSGLTPQDLLAAQSITPGQVVSWGELIPRKGDDCE